MKDLFLLIVLTQNGAGDINTSFVNTETLVQCQQKALMLEGVFTASDIPVLEQRCIQSPLQFTDFGHAAAPSKIRHFYLVSMDDNAVQVENMADWPTCVTQAKQAKGKGRVYCSSSVQSLVP